MTALHGGPHSRLQLTDTPTGSASEASSKRKHSLTENLAGVDAKRQATDTGIHGVSTSKSPEEGTNPTPTEQDLLNVLGLGRPGSRPDILKSTEDVSSPAGAAHQVQVIESSDEDMDYEDQAGADDMTDEDEDEDGETEGDLEINTTGTPSAKAALVREVPSDPKDCN